MKLSFELGKSSLSVAKDTALLQERHALLFLAHPAGQYIALPFAGTSATQFQGYHTVCYTRTAQNYLLYKTVEDLHIDAALTKVVHGLDFFERHYTKKISERFTLTKDALLYTLKNYSGIITVELDFRRIFDHPEFGRIYAVYPAEHEDDCIIVEYTQYTGDDLKDVAQKMYLAIKGVTQFTHNPSWIKKQYSYDASRGTQSEFYVYDGLRITCRKNLLLAFGCADDKSEAQKKAARAFDASTLTTRQHKEYVETVLSKKLRIAQYAGTPVAFAYASSIATLTSLWTTVLLDGKKISGLWAGLPWFFQYWSRDELVSLYALMLEGHYHDAKQVLLQQLQRLGKDGRLQNIAPGANLASTLGSADAAGWLFKRIDDYLGLLESRDEFDKTFTLAEITYLRNNLSHAIDALLREHASDGLIQNAALETWMDTYYHNGDYSADFRDGERIEIQALFLAMLRLMNKLEYLTANKMVKKKNVLVKIMQSPYAALEEEFRNRVRKRFLATHDSALYLHDAAGGEYYDVMRPNIFLAYYLYPALLSDTEWEQVFDRALERLWCEWDIGGGISTIDKSHPLYSGQYTGQDNKSYHRGDSWFYTNNIAALCLHRLNQKKYAAFIKKILAASTEDILYSGFIGAASELSSSAAYKPGGCFAQTWSIATYIELVHEMFIE